MRLLSGPPGSDATRYVLAEFRQALARGASNVRLIVPTATMAEHLRHLLARDGYAFRPGLIVTLSKFLAQWTGDLPEVSPPALHWIVESALRRLALPEFEKVARTPGFIATVSHAIDEFSTAGCGSARLLRSLPEAQFGRPFAQVYREVERELARRSWGMRADRLARAAERIAGGGLPAIDHVWMDGFFALTDPELDLVRAIAARADLTVVAPAARDSLLALGFEERRVDPRPRAPSVRAFRAPTIDREAEEIARLILEQRAAGREFRECGILVRNPDLYLHPLRAALERFGIPARYYFTGPLEDHPVARRLSRLVAALRGDWDYAATLEALRCAAHSPDLDRFDFAVRSKMPAQGLAALRELAPEGEIRRALDDLASLDPWRTIALPPAQWTARLASLRRFVPAPRPSGGEPYDAVLRLRSDACALAAFEAALEQAAQLLDPARRIRLEEFWTAAETAIRHTPLRTPDPRRNVVHVMSVHEARQWDLPCVFICGLAEQQFPKREAQEPLFPDSARARLAAAGVRIRAAADREREEAFLFELAQAAASAVLTLSYPEADARGARTLPSPFLEGRSLSPAAAQVRPEPATQIREPNAAPLAGIAPRHFSASALECFLGCPFQHFARNTLRLAGRPLPPRDRLDYKLQGAIVHKTIAEWHNNPQPIEPLFESIFAAACREHSIPPGYRAESLRRQMRDDLARFAAAPDLPPGSLLTEHSFLIELDGSLPLKGRIDRIDRLPDGRALIVDYKYSGKQGVSGRMDNDAYLQAGLYTIAVERDLKLKPAAFFYYGLKADAKIAGWSDPPNAFGIQSEPLTSEWMAAAAARARDAAEQIRAGVIAPNPAAPELCRLCDYNDICRYAAARVGQVPGLPGAGA